MLRKWWSKLGLALLALVMLVAAAPQTAWAAPVRKVERPGHAGKRALGQVTAVGENQFTLLLRDGREVTVLVDEQTHFRLAGGGEATFDDLTVGRWVVGAGRPTDQDSTFVARVVVLLPEDFDPGQLGDKAAGRVEAVDAAADTFVVTTRDGEQVTVRVDEQTRFRGVEGLEQLQPGMFAAAAGKRQDDGTLLARLVAAREHPDLQRFAGKVSAVDATAVTFTLTTREGQEVTFAVVDKTRFRGVEGLEQLQPGMAAVVGAVQDESGRWVALIVAAGQRPDLQRFGGVVVNVSDQGFTLETQGEGQVTFVVTEATRFHGIGGLADLKNGMKAVVGAVQDENGRWVAVVVGARQGGQPPRDGVRFLGRVEQVGNNALTLTTHDGQTVTVRVTGETRFRGVTGLDDLQPGQGVLVLAKETGGGYHALLIAARVRGR